MKKGISKKNKKNNNRSIATFKRPRRAPSKSNFRLNRSLAPLSMGSTTSFNNNSKIVRLKRRELISDVGSGTGMFKLVNKSNGLITSIANLALNAGLNKVFPWLSTIAPAFEKFVFHTLNFSYEPTCPSSTTGNLTMALNSNPSNPETSTVESDYCTKSNAIQTSLWKPAKLSIPSRRMQETTKAKIVRTDMSSVDKNLTDAGIVDCVLSSDATNTASTFGKLYCDYDVELINPKSNRKTGTMVFNGSATLGYTQIVLDPTHNEDFCSASMGNELVSSTNLAIVRVNFKVEGIFWVSLVASFNNVTDLDFANQTTLYYKSAYSSVIPSLMMNNSTSKKISWNQLVYVSTVDDLKDLPWAKFVCGARSDIVHSNEITFSIVIQKLSITDFPQNLLFPKFKPTYSENDIQEIVKRLKDRETLVKDS